MARTLLVLVFATIGTAWTPAAPALGQTATSSEALTLPQLVQLALKQNRLIKIDEARVKEAEALVGFAAAQAYPQFGGRLLFGGPVSEAKTTVINDVSTLTDASYEGDFNFGDLGVTLRMQATGFVPIFTFGKLSTARAAAEAVVRAAEENVHVTEGVVAVNVHRAYWAYQLTDKFLGSLSDGDKILADVIKKVEDLLAAESDQVTENDRLRLLHARATLQVRRHEAKDARDIALTALKLLVSRPMGQPLDVASGDIEELPPAAPPIAQVIDDAVRFRPELRALSRVVDAQEQFVSFRRRALFPDLFIGAFLETAITTNATDHTNPFVYDRFNFFEAGVALGIQFQLDVFNKVAQIDQAQAELETRIAQTAAAAEGVELEVRKIHIEVTGNYEKMEPALKAYKAGRSWLTAAALAYDIGTGDAGELIDAFLASATAEADLRRTQYEIQLGRVDLSRASGTLLIPQGQK